VRRRKTQRAACNPARSPPRLHHRHPAGEPRANAAARKTEDGAPIGGCRKRQSIPNSAVLAAGSRPTGGRASLRGGCGAKWRQQECQPPCYRWLGLARLQESPRECRSRRPCICSLSWLRRFESFEAVLVMTTTSGFVDLRQRCQSSGSWHLRLPPRSSSPRLQDTVQTHPRTYQAQAQILHERSSTIPCTDTISLGNSTSSGRA